MAHVPMLKAHLFLSPAEELVLELLPLLPPEVRRVITQAWKDAELEAKRRGRALRLARSKGPGRTAS